MSDVPTTPRKILSPRARLALFEAHQGKCALCGLCIRSGEAWIDEHLRPLGLGGSNDLGNRAPAHVRCASAKTAADVASIAKAKRSKRAALGIKPQGAATFQSRGFAKFTKPARAGVARIDKDSLPQLVARAMFEGEGE